jgi:hypothetical protein
MRLLPPLCAVALAVMPMLASLGCASAPAGSGVQTPGGRKLTSLKEVFRFIAVEMGIKADENLMVRMEQGSVTKAFWSKASGPLLVVDVGGRDEQGNILFRGATGNGSIFVFQRQGETYELKLFACGNRYSLEEDEGKVVFEVSGRAGGSYNTIYEWQGQGLIKVLDKYYAPGEL